MTYPSTQQRKVIGVDPGTAHGAYAVWDTTSRKIIDFGDIVNDDLLEWLRTQTHTDIICCETIQSYGQNVGAETFETCFFIGRVQEICWQRKQTFVPVKRKEAILTHCCSQKATDAQIRKAMLEYAGETGNKKNPGPTYGVSGHVWSALAIATFLPAQEEMERKIAEMKAAKSLK
jgi:hypothetical protein